MRYLRIYKIFKYKTISSKRLKYNKNKQKRAIKMKIAPNLYSKKSVVIIIKYYTALRVIIV